MSLAISFTVVGYVVTFKTQYSSNEWYRIGYSTDGFAKFFKKEVHHKSPFYFRLPLALQKANNDPTH